MPKYRNANINFTIRSLRRNDIREVIKNYYSRYEELERNPDLGLAMQEAKPSMKSEFEWAKRLMKDIRQRNAIALVAVVDGHVVGMCDIRTELIMEKQHVGSLGIAINDGYRSLGIGTALMRKIIAKSRGRFEILRLDVLGINRRAMSLYKRLGFKVYGKLPKGYMRGQKRMDHIMMYLRL